MPSASHELAKTIKKKPSGANVQKNIKKKPSGAVTTAGIKQAASHARGIAAANIADDASP